MFVLERIWVWRDDAVLGEQPSWRALPVVTVTCEDAHASGRAGLGRACVYVRTYMSMYHVCILGGCPCSDGWLHTAWAYMSYKKYHLSWDQRRWRASGGRL